MDQGCRRSSRFVYLPRSIEMAGNLSIRDIVRNRQSREDALREADTTFGIHVEAGASTSSARAHARISSDPPRSTKTYGLYGG
jgi:hypothetical protein